MAELSREVDEVEPTESEQDRLVKAFPILAHANAANAITSLSIALGIAASFLAIEGHLLPALLLGPLTVICDSLDGYIARRTGTTSEFGAQLDSLADAISFGIVPAMLGYGLGMRGLLELFLVWFALGSVWRLARFGQVGLTLNTAGHECFEGMPTTFVGGMLYVITPIALLLPGFGQIALLTAYFAVGPLLMNSSLLIPKRSWATRALWVIGPLATFASWRILR